MASQAGAAAYSRDATPTLVAADASSAVPAETRDLLPTRPNMGGNVIAGPTGLLSGSRPVANKAAGDAARDAIKIRYPGSDIEQTYKTGLGARRLDVVTSTGFGLESKLGRTSLTPTIQRQIDKDKWLMANNPDITAIEWHFARSAVTGLQGPTGPLATELAKAGIKVVMMP